MSASSTATPTGSVGAVLSGCAVTFMVDRCCMGVGDGNAVSVHAIRSPRPQRIWSFLGRRLPDRRQVQSKGLGEMDRNVAQLMNADRFQLVVHLFEHACLLEGAARSAFLADECPDDPDLRRQVEAMLAHDVDPGAAVGAPGGGGPAVLAASLARAERAAAPIAQLQDGDDGNVLPGSEPGGPPVLSGQYRILRTIGEGGMGVVYEAEQVRPRRIVALKAIRRGMASQRMLQRFALEADILGRLHHPGIAQIYEAGAADEAQPDQAFFAMEYVGGPPLTEYAARRRLSTRQRLRLLIKVCDAVQHAHQRGVIHRDLKPANILVVDDEAHATDQEIKRPGDGLERAAAIPACFPKILDFGVARLIGSDAQHPT